MAKGSKLSYKMFDGLKTEGETGKVKGYASSFDTTDEVGEVVLKGAFSKSLEARGDVRLILSQHDAMSNPIGSARVFEDEKGLGFEGTIVTSTSQGHDTYELIKAGVLTKMSIGYNVDEDSWKDGIRYLKEIDLREISVVTFPANEDTEVGAMKMKSIDTVRKLASLKEAEIDDELMKELSEEDILDAEKFIKRLKKERGMDDEEEEKELDEEDEKPEEEEKEADEEEPEEGELTDDDIESAKEILDILRVDEEEEDEDAKASDEDEDEEEKSEEEEEQEDD